MEKYKFQAKNQDGLLEKAVKELNTTEDNVLTKLYEEKGGLFSGKKYTIEVVKLEDIAETGKDIIIEFANKMNLHPGIIVGRLQKEHLLSYDNKLNELKNKQVVQK